jgi:hypothetical protein
MNEIGLESRRKVGLVLYKNKILVTKKGINIHLTLLSKGREGKEDLKDSLILYLPWNYLSYFIIYKSIKHKL